MSDRSCIGRRAAFCTGLAMALLTSGCGSTVVPEGGKPIGKPLLVRDNVRAGTLSMSMTPEVQAYATAQSRFDHWNLRKTFEETLRAEKLLTTNPDSAAPSIAIVIVDVRIRPTNAAVWGGAFAGDDRLAAEVTLTAGNGDILMRFSIVANYAWGGALGGGHDTRTGWLYRSLATRLVEALAGKPTD